MRLCYADPPYLGCCALYKHNHPAGDRPFDGRCWDEQYTHLLLIDWLGKNFDGWAMSASSASLRDIIVMCPAGTRVGSWSKPFASFKPNVTRAWTWEPVFFHGGRAPTKAEPTVRDHVVASITLKKGLVGAKPPAFCAWVLDFLGWRPGDEFVDLFLGTGAMTEALANREARLSGEPLCLEIA